MSALYEPACCNASNGKPAVIEPSPIIATCFCSFLPNNPAAIDIPNAAEMEVDECPTPNASYSLSLLLGNPLMPPYFLFV